MGLEQASTESERGTAAPEASTLRESLPVETLAGSLDFTPKPTKVADMGTAAVGTGEVANEVNDGKQYLDFRDNIYGQSALDWKLFKKSQD